jgi:hypothetical protein
MASQQRTALLEQIIISSQLVPVASYASNNDSWLKIYAVRSLTITVDSPTHARHVKWIGATSIYIIDVLLAVPQP